MTHRFAAELAPPHYRKRRPVGRYRSVPISTSPRCLPLSNLHAFWQRTATIGDILLYGFSLDSPDTEVSVVRATEQVVGKWDSSNSVVPDDHPWNLSVQVVVWDRALKLRFVIGYFASALCANHLDEKLVVRLDDAESELQSPGRA